MGGLFSPHRGVAETGDAAGMPAGERGGVGHQAGEQQHGGHPAGHCNAGYWV